MLRDSYFLRELTKGCLDTTTNSIEIIILGFLKKINYAKSLNVSEKQVIEVGVLYNFNHSN